MLSENPTIRKKKQEGGFRKNVIRCISIIQTVVLCQGIARKKKRRLAVFFSVSGENYGLERGKERIVFFFVQNSKKIDKNFFRNYKIFIKKVENRFF